MKEGQHPILQALQDYFDNTPKEQLERDFEELEKFNQYGPDMEECLELGRQHCIETMKEMDRQYVKTFTDIEQRIEKEIEL